MPRHPKAPHKPVGKKPAGKKNTPANAKPEEELTFTNTGKRKIEHVDIEMVGVLKFVQSFTPDEIEFEQGGNYKTDFEPTDQVFYNLEEEIKQCLEENMGIQVEFTLDNCYFETLHVEYAPNKKTNRAK